ncbi:trypco2 family protein [Planobispora rosea]|uniref:trypco2 family protein n=1 Tax=Planobispora rosea TaxID=35762 RepID=UPI00083B985B|nr:trypco2 family protein [Planobispora rosea]
MDIELTKAVAAMRDELLQAAVDGADSQIAFTVGPIELEFAVEFKADLKAKTGFKAWVISGDLEAGAARGRTHKVKVTLTPKHRDGGDFLISSRSAAGDGVGDGPGEVAGRPDRDAID